MTRGAAKLHVVGDVGVDDFPRVSKSQPLVRDLVLPPVANHLIEDAELVAQPVPDRGNIQRRQRIHVTGRKAAEPAIAQPGFLLLVDDVRQVMPEIRHRVACRVPQPEVDQPIAEVRSRQEFSGEIRDDLRAGLRC
jgi:hypothetical protein